MKGAALVGVLGLSLGAMAGGTPPQSSKKPAMSAADASMRLAKASAGFTENVGQWNSQAKFLSRTRNVDVWITSEGAVYDYYMLGPGKTPGAKGHVVRMSFDGATSAQVLPAGTMSKGRIDFLKKGMKSAQTAQRYSSVIQKGLYQGIDAKYYVDAGRPRYDLIVAPNADPSAIGLRFEGPSGVKVRNGEIVLGTSLGSLKNARPVAYQGSGKDKKIVAANYVMRKNGSIGIDLGAFDHSKRLVIDPLVYGSYYGGESGNDEVRNIVADLDGGVYLVGQTRAPDFPALAGPYGFNSHGGSDAFVAKLRGDAYENIYAAYFGGTQNDYAQFCSLDPFGNLWIAGRTFSTDFPSNPRDNVQFLTGDFSADGGTFRLSYRGSLSPIIPFNATTQQVFNALNAIGLLTNRVKSVTVAPQSFASQLPGATYRIVTDGDLAPFPITVVNEDNLAGDQSVFGLKAHVFTNWGRNHIDPTPNPTILFNPRSTATSGAYLLTFKHPVTGATATTGAIDIKASAGDVLAALSALNNLSNGTFSVTGGRLSPVIGQPLAPFRIFFTPQNAQGPVAPDLTVPAQAMNPSPTFTTSKFSDIFVMRWAKDSVKVLNPAPDRVQMFGGDGTEFLAGFAVRQNDNPAANEDVLLGFAGDTDMQLNEISNFTNTSFVARYTFNGTAFTKVAAATKHLEGFSPMQVGGFAIDRDGDGYLTGSVGETLVNDDHPTDTGRFPTTDGIFLHGDKLRWIDAFVRKYDQAGNLVISGLIGGNENDIAGGFDIDPHGVGDCVGSAIAVDSQKNIFVTGISGSFNFPRTNNVFGEVFPSAATVSVTKIKPDGSDILYSTNLRTTGFVVPSGIAVDPAGNAYIAGTCHANFVDFPQTNGNPPADPNEPVGQGMGAIWFPTPKPNPDPVALDPDYTTPAFPDFPTTEGWINVLDQTAGSLIYRSYIGGFLDEMVYGPYVDRFGDVWVNGWTDSARRYVRIGTTGTVKIYNDTGSLPLSLISSLAFKSSPAAGGGTGMTLLYGGYGDRNGDTWGPFVVGATYQRDGFLNKLRVGNIANIASITLNPTTVPGGQGATSTGTVTLTAPAPGGNAEVELLLDNNSASFNATAPQSTLTLTIPAGSATGTFTIFTNAVTANTAVQVKATYLGSFQVARLNVVPWLQSVGVTPNSLVGGNITSGRVNLAANAPTGGLPVTLTTNTPSLISFPNGATVTVPAGQSSVSFNVQTLGVDVKSFANVTASALGVNRTAAVTLNTANLLSLTFNPTVVAGLSKTTGTIVLDGAAGPNGFNVTIGGLPANYTITPSTLHFGAQDKSKTFVVTTPNESISVTRRATATRAATGGSSGYLASSVANTFDVVTATIASVTVDPATVDGGNTVDVTVRLNAPAPASGVEINLATSPTGILTLPATISIPAGAQAFTVEKAPTKVISATKVITIKASRSTGDTKSATLTVNGAELGIFVVPTSVSGGTDSTGTVTLARPAGAGGLTVTLSSNKNAVAKPRVTSVVIQPGETSADFQIQTFGVASNTDVTITGSLGAGTTPVSTTLEVRMIGVASVTFGGTSVRGGSPILTTVKLDAKAPKGGITVTLSVTNSQFSGLPATVFFAEGEDTWSRTLNTKRVSRDQLTTLTAFTEGASASASLLVKRGL